MTRLRKHPKITIITTSVLKGNLSLASPIYVSHFSKLLKDITKKTYYASVDGNNTLPDKDEINNVFVLHEDKDAQKIMKDIISISNVRLKECSLSQQERTTVIFDVINRILNSKIGRVVKKYQSDFLTRKRCIISYSVESKRRKEAFIINCYYVIYNILIIYKQLY